MIDNLRPLTQEQRQVAHRAARRAVTRAIGPQPAREQFADHKSIFAVRDSAYQSALHYLVVGRLHPFGDSTLYDRLPDFRPGCEQFSSDDGRRSGYVLFSSRGLIFEPYAGCYPPKVRAL